MDMNENALNENEMDAANDEKNAMPKAKEKVSANISAQEYVQKRYEEFTHDFSGIARSEDEWYELRSQINSALKLGIDKTEITDYIKLPYNYSQREVLKYSLWTGISREVLDNLTSDMTYVEMITKVENEKNEKKIKEMVDKPLDSMSQMLTAVMETVNGLQGRLEEKNTEMEDRIREKEEKIAELEEKLRKKEDEIKSVLDQTSENDRYSLLQKEMDALKEQHNKEMEKIQEEKLIQEKAESIAKKKFEEYKKNFDEKKAAEERIRQEERQRADDEIRRYRLREKEEQRRSEQKRMEEKKTEEQEKKRGFFKKKRVKEEMTEDRAETEGKTEDDSMDFSTCDKLPSDFDIVGYIMEADLPSDVFDLIAIAAKCGCPKEILKKIADSGLPAEKLKPIIEVYLVQQNKEQYKFHTNDVGREEDTIYAEE